MMRWKNAVQRLRATIKGMALVASWAGTTALAADSAAKPAFLDDPQWNATKTTAAIRQKVLADWLEKDQKAKVEPTKVATLYKQLGDTSFKVRRAASKELIALNPKNLDVLEALVAKDNDPEATTRAKEVIAHWKKLRMEKPIRIRNVFRAWDASSAKIQLQYAKPLVNAILESPAVAKIPRPDPIDCGRAGMLIQGPIVILLHVELLPRIANTLYSHKSHKARLILKSFLKEENERLLLRTMALIGNPREGGSDIALELIRLAKGKKKVVVMKALSCLSNWSSTNNYREQITATLKGLYDNKDKEIALKAGIISCYSGDWSGFPILLDATKSKEKKIALTAIGQLVDCQFRRHADKVMPLLMPHLKSDDPKILERTIETLGAYKGSAVHIIPFLNHENKHVVWRAILALSRLKAKEAIKPLEELKRKTNDKTTLRNIDEALQSLKGK